MAPKTSFPLFKLMAGAMLLVVPALVWGVPSAASTVQTGLYGILPVPRFQLARLNTMTGARRPLGRQIQDEQVGQQVCTCVEVAVRRSSFVS